MGSIFILLAFGEKVNLLVLLSHLFYMLQWSERRRFDIAGLISSVLRAHMHAYDPLFSMTLRYLIRSFFNSSWSFFTRYIYSLSSVCACPLSSLFNILLFMCSIHKGFCFRKGISSPISDLTLRLLLEERDPPATPQESFYEVPPFDEVRFLEWHGFCFGFSWRQSSVCFNLGILVALNHCCRICPLCVGTPCLITFIV